MKIHRRLLWLSISSKGIDQSVSFCSDQKMINLHLGVVNFAQPHQNLWNFPKVCLGNLSSGVTLKIVSKMKFSFILHTKTLFTSPKWSWSIKFQNFLIINISKIIQWISSSSLKMLLPKEWRNRWDHHF